MKINWKKVCTVGAIVAGIIGAGCEMAGGFIDLKEESKTPELPGPNNEESK